MPYVSEDKPASMRTRRVWFSILTVALFAAFLFQIIAAWKDPGVAIYDSSMNTPFIRIFLISAYFTVWSAGTAAFAALFVVLQPDGETLAVRALWVTAVMMTTLTAVIYQMYMGMDVPQEGIYSSVNTVMHRVVPALTVGTFLTVGLRGWVSSKTVGRAFIIPGLWLLYAIGAGYFAHIYPYIFMDPTFLPLIEIAKIFGKLLLFGVFLGVAYWLYDKGAIYFLARVREKNTPGAVSTSVEDDIG